MKYIKPTYEEYCKAGKFAKFRYRFGVYVQIIALFLLLFLSYYTITNIEEMKANPINYTQEKMNVICYPEITFESSTPSLRMAAGLVAEPYD